MNLNGDQTIKGDLVIDTGDGKVVIEDVADLLGGNQPVLSVFRKEGDANAIITMSSYAGFPIIAMGVGGSTAVDTAILRAAAGDITSRGDGLGAFVGGHRFGAVNAQTGTSYTIAVDDRSKIITRNNGSASTQTWPADAGTTPAIAVGSFVFTMNYGAGTITHSAGANASLASSSSTVQKQGQLLIGFKTAADTWWLWSPEHNHDSTYAALAHKSRHATGGADALTPSDIGAVKAETTGAKLWIGTQAAYDAIGSKDSTTVYIVEG